MIVDLLERMKGLEASDLFLTVGKEAKVKRFGVVENIGEGVVQESHFSEFFEHHLPPSTLELLERERDLDIGISLSEDERYRLNLYFQQGRMALVARRVPQGALDMDQLNLPAFVKSMAQSPQGLILITGPSGSGKSTTMSSILHYINQTRKGHIVTIEDPIEFLHHDIESLVSQREVRNDTKDFKVALKQVVRQSPDVIFIGEMRDFETIQIAISAAMTGHLVITTMHTVDATQTLERIIHYFPHSIRDQVVMDLSLALKGIISQRLLPSSSGTGVLPALETMVTTPRIQHLIRQERFDEIEEAIKGGSEEGMQTMVRSIANLCLEEKITMETGLAHSARKEEFKLIMKGMESGIDTFRQAKVDGPHQDFDMKTLLKAAIQYKASDLLLTVGSPPLLRIEGAITPLKFKKLVAGETERLLFSLLSSSQRKQFEVELELDFALTLEGSESRGYLKSHRFRANGYYQRGSISCAIRLVPQKIPNPEDIGIPPPSSSIWWKNSRV